MKTKIFLLSNGIFLICKMIFAQQYPCGMPSPIVRYNVPSAQSYSNVEMIIYNQTLYYGKEDPNDIKVRIIPVGAFFNEDRFYTPNASTIISHSIAGKEIIIPVQLNDSSSYIRGNWDRSGGNSFQSQFSYGYGKYKFEFYRKEEDTVHGGYYWVFSNHVYIDFRDTGPNANPDSANGSMADMRLDYFTKDTITYQFDARHNADNSNYKYKFWHIDLVNKELKVWDKYGTCIPSWIPDRGSFYPDVTNASYLKWPLNANQYNGNLGMENPGDLGMNLIINHNITTRDTALGNGSITIAKNGYLKIADGKTFNMTTPLAGYHNLVIRDSSLLWLDANSHLFVGSGNRLTLKSKGAIKLGYNSEIRFRAGSLFCNEG